MWQVQAYRIAQADDSDFNAFISSMDRLTHDILEDERADINSLKRILEK